MSSSDLTVNRAGPADLIASVWYTLGFRPRNSLVLIALHGPRGRVGSMLRIDITPAWFGPDGVAQVLDAALDSVTGSGAASFAGPRAAGDQLRVVALVVSDDALDVPAPPLVRALPQRLLRAGVWVYDLIGLSPSAFRSLACPDQGCCPPGGRPLSEVESSRVALAHVLRGDRLADSQNDLISDVGEPVPSGPAGSVGPGETGDERSRRRWWRTWNGLLARLDGWSTDDLGTAELADSFLRDAVFVRVAAVAGTTRLRFLNQLLSGQSPPDLGEQWEELFGGPPDRELIARAEEVLAALARRGTVSERGPVLALLALLAWYRGNGVRTRLLMERLRAENPVLPGELPRLAGLVETLCASGIAPPWVETAEGRGGRAEPQ